MLIKILGTWCPSCIKLEANVKLALERTWIKSEVQKITDIVEIMNYNIMSNPWLVINEKVVSYGKICEVDEIISILENELCCSNEDSCDLTCNPTIQKNNSKWWCSCGGNC